MRLVFFVPPIVPNRSRHCVSLSRASGPHTHRGVLRLLTAAQCPPDDRVCRRCTDREHFSLLSPSHCSWLLLLLSASGVIEAAQGTICMQVTSPALWPTVSNTHPKKHLVTPIPDHRGTFQLKPVEDTSNDKILTREMDKLQVSDTRKIKRTQSKNFIPLEDVPVDSHDAQNIPLSTSSSRSARPNWLLTEPTKSPLDLSQAPSSSPSDNKSLPMRSRKDHKDLSENSKASRTTRSRSREKKDNAYSVLNKPKKSRPILSQIFGGVSLSPSNLDIKLKPVKVEMEPNHVKADLVSQNGFSNEKEEEYELVAVTVSKMKQSLGISISGGIESKIQPVVKIEKIFPGGAAFFSGELQAGYELVSVDGETLQNVTHQRAVDVIRQSYSNKQKEPMELVVKIPKKTEQR